MTENELEKKINLLFKVLINLDAGDNGKNPIFEYMDEYIQVFNLSVEVKHPERMLTAKEFEELIKKEGVLLNELREKYKDENISIKEHREIEIKIKNQLEKLEFSRKLAKQYGWLIDSMKDLREELLRLELKKKVGIELIKEESGDDGYYYRRNDFVWKEQYEDRMRKIAKEIRRLWKEYDKIGK